MRWTDYWKGLLAAVGEAITVVTAAVTDNQITDQEWGLIATGVVTILLVVFGPRNTNTPPA